ncbi:iron-sulfur cluster assembly scaffold protein [Sphingomonas sp. BN140010]|uniref:Iron-sulfur cluster assembly scaffold protein n=1 Tax=Sphingomonas arvum TaxID=2992113 RepID=A0ABT3JCQ7_9SPHN|nr:iron-sulfur cluster assembly scaffold protein [Sphingomonas sp. BN140010]MCW3796814.1 iron-sulfur cluster assembly scaffold protein [Sphingomonas sp. BN140010]
MSSEPVYTLEVLRLAASLPLETSLSDAHGRAEKRSTTCGSVITTEVRLDDGRLVQVAQQVQACAFGQASAALLQQFAAHRSPVEIVAARVAMRSWLAGSGEPPAGFEVLAPARAKTGRHGAMLLPFDALIAALRDAGA